MADGAQLEKATPDGNWKDHGARVSQISAYRSAIWQNGEERRYLGYMRGRWKGNRHVLPFSDWLGQIYLRKVATFLMSPNKDICPHARHIKAVTSTLLVLTVKNFDCLR